MVVVASMPLGHAAPASAVPSCFGQRATLLGTEGRDVLRGTARRDVIVSLGGNDAISARQGDDLVCAGPGDDLVLGREGSDRILGESGGDYLFGDQDRDVVIGGAGNDRVSGDRARDAVYGGLGNDEVFGGGEPDVLRGEAGNDIAVGGSGNDRLYGGDGHDLVDGTKENDVLDGGAGFDYGGFLSGDAGVRASLFTDRATGQGDDVLVSLEGLVGSERADRLEGDGSVNWIFGGKASDRIDGAGGDDRLWGEERPDELIGGPGTDALNGGDDRDRCLRGEQLTSCEVLSYFLTVNSYGASVTSSPQGIDCGHDCEEPVQPGDRFTLTAHERPDQVFVRWDGGPCHNVTTLTCEFTVEGDIWVSALFRFRPRLDVTVVPSGGGTVSDPSGAIACEPDCSEHFEYGSTVLLTATPAEGWRFVRWAGPCGWSTPTCNVRMDQAQAVTAEFVRQHVLTVTKTGEGSGTVTSTPAGISCGADCDQTYDEGTAVTLTASPSDGSMFVGWGGDCSGTATTCTLTIDQARAASAQFAAVLP